MCVYALAWLSFITRFRLYLFGIVFSKRWCVGVFFISWKIDAHSCSGVQENRSLLIVFNRWKSCSVVYATYDFCKFLLSFSFSVRGDELPTSRFSIHVCMIEGLLWVVLMSRIWYSHTLTHTYIQRIVFWLHQQRLCGTHFYCFQLNQMVWQIAYILSIPLNGASFCSSIPNVKQSERENHHKHILSIKRR